MRMTPAGKAVLVCLIVLTAFGTSRGRAQNETVGEFFRTFTADWIRHDPDMATRVRYLTGDEQEQLERQLTPRTSAWKTERIARAKTGLARLASFNRARFTPTEQVSADVMQWQLQTIVDEESFLDQAFALEQFQGSNVSLLEAFTANHPLRTERDGGNYVARLGQLSARMARPSASRSGWRAWADWRRGSFSMPRSCRWKT